MADTPEAIRKSIRTYLIVGAALFVCTVLTVMVATIEALDFGKHGFDGIDLIIGLGIALFKVVLVAAIFMHLNHEKKMIYWIFFGSFVFAAALYLLTLFAKKDPIRDPLFYGEPSGVSDMMASPTMR